MPTEKGAGRRDTRGQAAPRHRFCTSTTDSNQLQKQGSCRRKSSGQQGTGSRLLLGAVCQPGTGAPGLCWRPLGDSRDAARCPTVSWVCQGRSPPPLSPCAARSSPDPWQHQAQGSSQCSHPESPCAAGRGSPSPAANTLASSLAGSSRDGAGSSAAPTAPAEPASDSDSHCSARDTQGWRWPLGQAGQHSPLQPRSSETSPEEKLGKEETGTGR